MRNHYWRLLRANIGWSKANKLGPIVWTGRPWTILCFGFVE